MIKFNNYSIKNRKEFIPISNKDKISRDRLFGPVKIGKLLISKKIVLFNLDRDSLNSTCPIEYREHVQEGDYYNYIWFTSLEDYNHFVDIFNPIVVNFRDNYYSNLVMESVSKECFRILYKR